jgi:hypothetical protein
MTSKFMMSDLPTPTSQQSWARSQHSPTQPAVLRSGRRISVKKVLLKKKSEKSPLKFINEKDLQITQVPVNISFSRLRNPKKYQEVTLLKFLYFCEEFPHILYSLWEKRYKLHTRNFKLPFTPGGINWNYSFFSPKEGGPGGGGGSRFWFPVPVLPGIRGREGGAQQTFLLLSLEN